MPNVTRREFIATAAAASAASVLPGASALAADLPAWMNSIPIIDSHIHLFDGSRPLGAEYMGSAEYRAKSKTSLPSMYAPLARPAGVVGAIVVESSAWIDDNLWYIEVAHADPFMVGVCGSLDPGRPDFGEYVAHFAKDPLYRAIRFSRFYNDQSGSTPAGAKVSLKPDHVANLKHLAEADLVLDTANPSMPLMQANVLLADAIPNLRIIMDHLPSFDPTPENQPAYESVVEEMAAHPNIFVKLSEVYHPRLTDNVIVHDFDFLGARLEYLYGIFGEDRVLFGSDYPNSYGVATIPEEVSIMKQFFATRTRQQAEKYFWRNSARIYKWQPRTPQQSRL
jgi:L-fuconolactonase